MHRVTIDLSVTYEGNLSPMEKHPQLVCYLDARFEREPVKIQLTKEKVPFPVRVTGTLTKATKTISPVASLCFASMAWRPNEFGVPCLLDTGVAHVNLGKLRPGHEETMNLSMNTVEGLCKGRITIKVADVTGLRMGTADMRGALRTDTHVVPLITDYINETMGIEQGMKDTFLGTDNMRIPYDYSESGIQTTIGTPIPAIGFVMSETPKSNEGYWLNASRTVLVRDGLTADDWKRLNMAGKARATILTICYAAQYMDYVGDTVDRNTRFSEYDKRLVAPCENFGDALAMNSGDCEDLAGVELQCRNAFVALENTTDPILREMQTIARSYVPPLSLDVVRGAQVSDRVQQYGAHMNDNFIPINEFTTWLERTEEGKHLSKMLPKTKLVEGELPFLVGEGTGHYEPYGYDNPLLPIMSYVYRAPSLEFAKKPIMHKKGEPGSFFVGSLVGLTDYFYRQGARAPLAFWYCTKQANGTLTRGASYVDMMNKSDRVALKVQMPPGKAVMEVTEEAILKRIPPAPLFLTKSHPHRAKHSILEKISRSVANLKRAPGPKHQKVPVYVRPHQLTTARGNQIIGDFARMDRIWKVDYHLEEITDTLWGYRMEIYVNGSHS